MDKHITELESLVNLNNFLGLKSYLDKFKSELETHHFLFYLGLYYSGIGDDQEALKCFRNGYSAARDYLPLAINYFATSLKLGQQTGIIKLLRKQKVSQEWGDQFVLIFVNISLNLNENVTAKRWLSIVKDKENPDYKRLNATLGINNGEYSTSLKYFRQWRTNSEFEFNNYLVCLIHLGKYELIVEEYRKTTEFQKNQNVNLNYALALQYLGQYDVAISEYEKLRENGYKRPELFANLSRTYALIADFVKAKDVADVGLTFFPRNAAILCCKADACGGLNLNSEAAKLYTQSLKEDPENTLTQWHHSLWLIKNGHFKQGWEKYKVGFLRERNGRGEYSHDISKEWSGEEINELYVWHEQGVGDQIMFGLYLDQLRDRVKKVYLHIDERLIPVFQKYLKSQNNLEYVSNVPKNVKHIPMGNLPIFFERDVKDFPLSSPFKDYATQGQRDLIGISWRGGTNHRLQARRSVPVGLFRRIPSLKAKKIVVLQYDALAEELDFLKMVFGNESILVPKFNPTQDLKSWMDLIASCEQILTIDNSVAHFAGAINKKTTLMLPSARDFRWCFKSDETKNLWYSSVTNVTEFNNYTLDQLAIKIEGIITNEQT